MDQIEIRDIRDTDWHWVYNSVLSDPHLSPSEKLVYCALSTFSGYAEIRPSVKTIGERCSLSERAVQLAIKKLEKIDYIQVEKNTGRGHANIYKMLKRPKGCKFCTFSKGCKTEQERVQSTTIKGAESAPFFIGSRLMR